MPTLPPDPLRMIRPRRKITGISAVLLPFTDDGTIDWAGFSAHCVRTAEAGLTPAVNMDTGYVNLLSHLERSAVLKATRSALGGRPFAAGVFVADTPGASFDRDGYLRELHSVLDHGGTPVIFQSHGLTGLADPDLIAAYESIGTACDGFIAFELGPMFAPFGKIYSIDVYRCLLGVQKCLGAKHSSLRRQEEWDRLEVRDRVRPDFRVYTGNDYAIDMVIYGSDYLLGLSTFAPDLFARRDLYWERGDPRFYELNDRLQYLGFLGFRRPVPAYKHSAAMFLKLRGWLESDAPHPRAQTRPAGDREFLRNAAEHLEILA